MPRVSYSRQWLNVPVPRGQMLASTPDAASYTEAWRVGIFDFVAEKIVSKLSRAGAYNWEGWWRSALYYPVLLLAAEDALAAR